MIEKLDIDPTQSVATNHCIINKVNQLVDAVNELQLTVSKMENVERSENVQLDAETRSENVQDKFAEQRKWIGCVCRFWCDDSDNTVLDYLDKIQTGKNGIEYCGKETYGWFPHCEPILPTDNAIYKGE